jgi:carbamoyl-phosphate synthase large subunit
MMKRLKIIVTGAGAPGIGGTIYSLKNNFDNRPIEVIGTDVNDNVVGKYLCDNFYTIPKASNKSDYLQALADISDIEKPDIIIPQNTSELGTLADNIKVFEEKGIKVIVSNADSIERSNNKYTSLELCRGNGLSYPGYRLVNNLFDLENSIKELGWPEKRVIVKPPVSNGMRGFRIIDEYVDYKKIFYLEKPNNSIISFDDLKKILGDNFPDLLVSEYLPGDEYSVDILRTRDRIEVIPRKRTLIRSGITFNGNLEYNTEIINTSIKLSGLLNMEYCYGFQFKMDYNNRPQLLECNPRVQGTMVMSTIAGANLIYSAVKYALNEPIPEFSIDWNSSFYRYWGGVGLNKSQVNLI